MLRADGLMISEILFTWWRLIEKFLYCHLCNPPQTNKTKSVPIQGIADNKLVITVALISKLNKGAYHIMTKPPP